ncbi:hypothetical protein [Aestuariivirga sp.]|uniref:hypothetical protein n=1 Tax=Aestuariivirga sp. TaxID=2650926 RepID=UPI0025C34698|nr:hypothetical protein [Aestuariivirga sp.]MCA3556223.1 hypothetical protein [Aestuariivirga sp.]
MAGLSTIAFDAGGTLRRNETFFRLAEQRLAELLSGHAAHEAIPARLLEAGHRNRRFRGFGRRMPRNPVETTPPRATPDAPDALPGLIAQMT